jgi:hypothetical protein
MGCFKNLSDSKMEYINWDKYVAVINHYSKPFCKACYLRLPGDIKRKVNKYQDLEKKLTAVA